jgi:hypothetical protein
MKKIILSLTITITFLSCHKGNGPQSPAPLTTIFRFTIAGKTDSIVGTQSLSTEGTVLKKLFYNATNYYYILDATKQVAPLKYFTIDLVFYTQTLKQQTYTFSYIPITDFNVLFTSGQVVTSDVVIPDWQADYSDGGSANGPSTVVITKIENGYVSGTWNTPKVTTASTCPSCPKTLGSLSGHLKM